MTRPLVMGILNVTPDSFSDGGRYMDVRKAIARAEALAEEGADILDIGGESTRPGAEPVDEAEEIARVVPVIAALRGRGVRISVDTMKPDVARAAVAAGAAMWNDVSALRWSEESPATAAQLGCEVVLMHMQGEPRTMQEEPFYRDVVGEVAGFLGQRADAAMAAGVPRDRIWLDPGIGFGKHMIDHNLPLLAGLDLVVSLGWPVLLGASRKRFITALDPTATARFRRLGPVIQDQEPRYRLGGSIAAALAGAASGVAAVRVHDVQPTVQALAVWEAIAQAGGRAS
ncbi:MAG: dihydropteroate synthase [Phenylobacterium sp.]